jgi:spore germination protein GerM
VAFVCVGCGVTVQSHPRPLATASSPRGTSLAGPVTRLTNIFLVRGDKVVVSHRAVPDPVTLQRIVQALLNGPTKADAGHGLRSAVPASLRMRRVAAAGQTAVVDLTSGLDSVSSHEQALALTQLVYTVTAQPGVSSLRVLVDGHRVEVARADGTLTTGDLTRADYRSLLSNA